MHWARPSMVGCLRFAAPPQLEAGPRGGIPHPANPVGDPLFEALRARRRELAAEAQMPPYVIFHDSTLREMATVRPTTLGELGRLGGVGTRKLEAYGEAFLAGIKSN